MDILPASYPPFPDFKKEEEDDILHKARQLLNQHQFADSLDSYYGNQDDVLRLPKSGLQSENEAADAIEHRLQSLKDNIVSLPHSHRMEVINYTQITCPTAVHIRSDGATILKLSELQESELAQMENYITSKLAALSSIHNFLQSNTQESEMPPLPAIPGVIEDARGLIDAVNDTPELEALREKLACKARVLLRDHEPTCEECANDPTYRNCISVLEVVESSGYNVDMASRMAKENIHSVLASILCTHLHHAAITASCCRAIRVMCRNAAMLKEFGELGVVGASVQILNIFKDRLEPLEGSMGMVSALVTNPKACVKLVELGAVPLVLAVTNSWSHSELLCVHAVQMFWSIASTEETKDSCVNNEVISFLVKVCLRNYSKHPVIVKCACGALTELLSITDFVPLLQMAEPNKTIANLLAIHRSNDEVSNNIALFAAASSQRGIDVVKCGIFNELILTLHQHTSSAKLIYAVAVVVATSLDEFNTDRVRMVLKTFINLFTMGYRDPQISEQCLKGIKFMCRVPEASAYMMESGALEVISAAAQAPMAPPQFGEAVVWIAAEIVQTLGVIQVHNDTVRTLRNSKLYSKEGRAEAQQLLSTLKISA